MHRIVLCVLATVVCSCLASAQDAPRGEIFGGYSYLNVDYQSGVASSSPIPRQSANGWEVSPAFNINGWLAIEGDFAGYYKNNVPFFADFPNADFHDYSFTAGPRFNYRAGTSTAFLHALVGGDDLYGSVTGLGSASQNSISFAIGGGVVWRVRPDSHWAVRGSGDYVLTRHNIANALGFSTPGLTQNNFRASVGVVYLFGRVQESQPRTQRVSTDSQRCSSSSEVALLGVMGCNTSGGFMVASVNGGSPAALSGLRSGDIITNVDGRAVRSSQDIETALSANTNGTVRLRYLIQGNYLTERDAKIR